MAGMVKVLKEALEEISSLPDADQETIGRSLLSHVEKLRRLRSEIDKGLRSLAAGGGKTLKIKAFIRQARARHGKA